MIKTILKPIVIALSTATLCLSAGNVFAGGPTYKMSINEFFRAGNLTTTDEWMEVVLLQDLTAAQLNTYFVGDSTGSTASKFSSYQFTNMENIAPTFCAGTIITVGGTTGPASDITYAPASNDWNLSLLTANANITSTTGSGNFAGNDVVYLDTVATGNTLSADGFAINWDGTPGVFGTNATFSLTGANRPNNNTGAFLNGSVISIPVEANWTSDTVIGSLSPGLVNGGANSTSIIALQAAALGTVTIADTPTNNEGNAGNTAFTFTVTRTASCVAASVDYAVTGTGANPADAADFGGVLPSGTANFASGATTATITINVSGDTTVEMDETFLVTLSNPAGVALGATTTDTGTITNDDVTPPFLTAIKSVSGNLSPGGLIAYNIVISNSGGIQNDNGTDEMTDVLPASLTVQSVSATSGVATNAGNTVSWNGSVASMGTVTVTINAMVDTGAAGNIENQAQVFFDNDNNGTNESTALSSPPMSMGPAPTVFFIPFLIPSLNMYGLMLLALIMLGLVSRRKLG